MSAGSRVMVIEKLHLECMRSIGRADLEFAAGTNVLVGQNAQGKTTVLEAICYLSTGRSLRTVKDREVIGWQAPEDRPFAVIAASVQKASARHDLRLVVEKTRKTVWRDGKALPSLSALWGCLGTVVFVPSDLQIVQGAPSQRREVLDRLIGQVHPIHLRHLGSARRALQSRNSLLRQRVIASDPQYDAFESTLADSCAKIIRTRAACVRRLSAAVAGPISELTDGAEALVLRYEPGLPEPLASEADQLADSREDVIAAALRDGWRRSRDTDLARGTTGDGPHRDDVAFEINNRDARAFASQGQARSCVLALRLAELDLMVGSSGETPVLILDDILAELDQDRSRRFLRMVAARRVQTIMTATDAESVAASLEIHRQFQVEQGKIRLA